MAVADWLGLLAVAVALGGITEVVRRIVVLHRATSKLLRQCGLLWLDLHAEYRKREAAVRAARRWKMRARAAGWRPQDRDPPSVVAAVRRA